MHRAGLRGTILGMLEVGPYVIESVVTGTIRLDGGAMFGVVPKVLWEKVSNVDEQNRILLDTRTLLAVDRARHRVILTDTGCGTKWTPEKAQRFAISYDPDAIPRALRTHQLCAEDVTDVIITHLHFDHNGGLTEWVDDPRGPTSLCYPHATHWIHKKHWEHAHDAYLKDQASFLPEDFSALEGFAGLHLVDTDEPIPPFGGMEWFVSHGHTPYQLHPIFVGATGERLFFSGDIVPTIAHLPLAWVMAYDVAPLATIREKETIYDRCFGEGMTLAFPHDPKVGGVAIAGTKSRPIVTRTLSL